MLVSDFPPYGRIGRRRCAPKEVAWDTGDVPESDRNGLESTLGGFLPVRFLVPGCADCVEKRLRLSASSSRFGPKVVEASVGRWTIVDCEPSRSQRASLRGQ